MTEIRKLILKRGQLKAKLTRVKNYFERLDSEAGIKQLQLRLALLREVFREFDSLQSEIELLDESDAQVEERVEFENLYFDLVASLEEYIESHTSSAPSPVKERIDNQIQVRLPVLDLPTFAEDYEEWAAFKDGFLALVHDNNNLSNTQKLFYLRSALKAEAAHVIQSLELTAPNYLVAWNIICERYDNKRIIIQRHVRGLFELVKIERESSTALRSLLDSTLKHIRALEAFQQPTDTWDVLLIHMVTSKLDMTTLREWETTCQTNELPTFKQLTAFLQTRCHMLENLAFSKQQSRVLPPLKQVSSIKSSSQGNKIGNNSRCLYVSGRQKENGELECCLCSGTHLLGHCDKFLKLKVEERYQEVKRFALCVNCLRFGHYSMQCRAGTCKTCGKHHHLLLHRATTRPINLENVSTHKLDSKNSTLEAKKTVLTQLSEPVSNRKSENYCSERSLTGDDYKCEQIYRERWKQLPDPTR